MAKAAVCFVGLLVMAGAILFGLYPMYQDAVDYVAARAPASLEMAAAYDAPDTLDPAALLAEDLRYMSVDHAVERHGDLSLVIKEACETNPAATRTRAADGRKIIGCEYEPGKWGAAIYEADGDFVTSFPNKAKTLEKLLQYFRNRGYMQ